MTKSIFTALLLVTCFASCKTDKKSESQSTESTQTAPAVAAPAFNADSAYAYIAKQVAFGPRVPNTAAHVKGGDYLVAKLKQFGFAVTEQKFQAKTWDGKTLNARNIIGSLNPQATKRIVLASHWDSRPRSDQDTTVADRDDPVLAANDGASGVGVLLELARTIQQAKAKPTVGIDLVFFDAEDWGKGEVENDTEKESGPNVNYMGFCLGSRHWAKNPHVPGYKAYYGILLDMVGAKGATFAKEGYSMQYAPSIVNQVWQTASQLGYSQFFIDTPGSPITDDHLAPNLIAKIPMIDIIHTSSQTNTGFFHAWHTNEDTMANIDRGTLKAVGQTLAQTLYNE
jgi:glutaminyl-peptide cyclotransferase